MQAAAPKLAGASLLQDSPVGGKDLVHILDQQTLGLGLQTGEKRVMTLVAGRQCSVCSMCKTLLAGSYTFLT
jgi:hypothetical protein